MMPNSTSRDHEYTLGLAESALAWIKSLRLPGDPASFEVWYTYVGRFIPALNEAINQALAAHGRISALDIDRIYDRHLGTFRLGEQVEKIGENVSGEVDRVVDMIDAAIGSAARYDGSLSDISRKLDAPIDRPALRSLVEALANATRGAAHENRGYKATLEMARTEIARMQDELEAVRFESRTDALTALANRKQFDQWLGNEIRRAAQTSEPLALLMCDVDHFKAFNDTWGHPLGDDVLRLVARVIREIVRQQDLAARYGGEEFAVVLPNTDMRAAADVAERIRAAVHERQICQRSTGKVLGRIGLSIGVAQWRIGESVRDLIERADACLYAAKRQGRNRVAWQLPEEEIEPNKFDAA